MGAKVSSGGSSKRGSYDTNADMNIIPFIDILLVLLIIFMVAAPIPTVDVKVDLPPPVEIPADLEKPKKPTLVDIVQGPAGDTQIFVDQAIVENIDDLPGIVYSRVTVNVPDSPNKLLETVRVRPDQRLSYGEVMGVMTVLQGANFQKVSLVAETALDESALAQ